MGSVSKSWMALVSAALLLGTLAGVVWARPHDRPQAQDITRKVTLTGADFIPHEDTDNWRVDGSQVSCKSGICYYHAAVVFPCLPSVTVERIRLHVHDGNASSYAWVKYYRAYPPTGAEVYAGEVLSPLGLSGGTKTYSSGAVNTVVWPSQRFYIWLYLGTNIEVYGVTVEYHRNI